MVETSAEPTPSRSRKGKKIRVDAEQYYRLASVGKKIGVYEDTHDAEVDNLELVLKTVLDTFEEEHIDE